MIGLYTHYFAGFLLAANGVVLVLSRKWGSVGRYLLDMIIPALALAAIIPFIPGQFENQHQAHELSSPLSSIVFMFGVIENFILGMDNIYNLPEVLKLVFLMVVALVWLIAIAVNFQPLRYFFKTKESKMLIIFSSLLIFVTAIHFLLGKSIAQTKYMNSLTIPTLFVFFTAFTLTPSKTWLIHAGAGVLLILYLIVTPLIFVPTIKTEDYKGIATYLEEHEENEEPVIIFENIHELVLKHHYHGDNFLYQFPVDIDFTKAWNHKNWVIQNDEQVEQYFSQKINYPETFWMVTHEKKTNQNIDLGHHHLESFLEQNYETVSTQNFQYMMRVRYMRRKY